MKAAPLDESLAVVASCALFFQPTLAFQLTCPFGFLVTIARELTPAGNAI